jgi:hypothetical protein
MRNAMRRTTLALLLALLPLTVAIAQQSQTPPPPATPVPTTPTPRVVVTPAPTTGQRVTVTVPGPGQQATGVVVAEPQGRGGQVAMPVMGGQIAQPVVAERVTTFTRNAGPASWQNVKLDVVISDSLVPDLQTKKAVSMLILDGLSGQVRSSAGEGLINIDARPTIRPDGRIYLQLTIEYRPELSGPQLQQAGLNRTALFSESLALLVADGKPVVASSSADPRSDRKVAIEVIASIIK